MSTHMTNTPQESSRQVMARARLLRHERHVVVELPEVVQVSAEVEDVARRDGDSERAPLPRQGSQSFVGSGA